MYTHSSDEDGTGDVEKREKQQKAELEWLDRQYFINDSMDATDGFFNKPGYGNIKYGTKKHQEDLAPLKSPFIQLNAQSEQQSELQGLSDSASRTSMREVDDTEIDGDANGTAAQGF